MLEAAERIRYACQMALPDFGEAAQARLKAARVVVVGAGGLGCPAAQYLVAAGVGQLTIADFDTVSAGNLHRQILYGPDDIGQFKAIVAAERLRRQNPHVELRSFTEKITSENVVGLFRDQDLILDCTDNFEARYLINDAAVLGGKPVVYGAIYQYEGQVALWNAPNTDGTRSPHYRDLFPEIDATQIPDCAEGGVLPALAGVIGCFQANEALRYLAGVGSALAGRLLLYDATTLQSRVIRIGAASRVPITGLPATLPTITAEAWLRAEAEHYTLVDVRTAEERAAEHLGGLHIPLGELEVRHREIPEGRPVLFYCASGRRSLHALQRWQQLRPGAPACSLDGGIAAVKLTTEFYGERHRGAQSFNFQ